MKLKKFILFLLVAGIVSTSGAQRILTLEEAIATALANNYDIRLSRNDSAVYALDYSYRNAVFLPRLNGTVNTVWNVNSQKQTLANGTERTGDNLKSNNLNSQLAMSWVLFDGLKMFVTRDKQAELMKLGDLVIKNQIVNTIAAVINTYYNVARQKQQLRAIEELMGTNQIRVTLAERKLDIGVGTKPEVLQSKVDLNAQRAAQLEQQTLIAQLKEQLNQAMNIKNPVPYDVLDTIPVNMSISLGDITKGIDTSNPQIMIARKNIDIAGFTLRERKAERFPTVAFNSAYNFSKLNNSAVINDFSTLSNRNRGFNYGFSVSIPILNNLNTRRLIKQAQLDIQYKQLTFENQVSQVNLAVMSAYIEYEQQKKALALEEENILLAKENVSIALEVYRLGASTLIQLREAQISLQDAYNRLIAARYNLKISETELLRLKGDILK
jgi:outer membrane protein